jgi:hypothetical protein
MDTEASVTIIELEPGDSPRNVALHESGQCGALCSLCYHEACEWLKAQLSSADKEVDR